MKAHRPQRGRVSKPSVPARGGPRRAGTQLAAHDALVEHQLKAADAAAAQDPSVFDDARMGAEQYAAATSVMHPDLTADAQADAEAEADMEDEDPTVAAAAAAAAAATGLAPQVDLATATSMLANGGQPVDDQHQDLQQSLAHAHQQQQQQQQQQQHQHQQQQQPQAQMDMSPMQQAGQQSMEQSFAQTTEQLAIQSGYESLNIESALAKRLAREPGQRLATQRRPDQVLNLARRSNVEALFAHIAGEPARMPCKNCHKGHGPWIHCVVVDGQMCGSCANCWFNASGARCSFHGKHIVHSLLGSVHIPCAD